MDIRSLLIAHAQSPKLIQPGEGPLYYPSPSAQPAAVSSVAHSEQWQNAPFTQTLTDRFRVIAAVSKYAIRAPNRMSSARSKNCFEAALKLL